MSMSPAEQLAHSTVRIECDLADGGVGTGTGFFYALVRESDQHIPVIITNKHVVTGATKGRFILTLRDQAEGSAIGSHDAFQLDAFDQRWTPPHLKRHRNVSDWKNVR